MKILLTQFKCKGVAMAKQSILSLYAYDITTGIVVDIGDRLNIVPVIDGINASNTIKLRLSLLIGINSV